MDSIDVSPILPVSPMAIPDRQGAVGKRKAEVATTVSTTRTPPKQPPPPPEGAESGESMDSWTLHGKLDRRYSKCAVVDVLDTKHLLAAPRCRNFEDIPNTDGEYEMHPVTFKDGRSAVSITHHLDNRYSQALLFAEMDNISIHRLMKKVFHKQYPVITRLLAKPDIHQLIPHLDTRVWLSSP
ncbi:uncharacterized protein LOC121375339 [Gigantopelta aegis]|uniref:uncharacterized protein LOC121375339 n=1 Tax=Gigantopelta aegis TaxID=1735272 RepID=UPI001B888C8C|nr:uncharacterized protein LOC121375339 [Gigantopelta aegis]